MEKNIFKNAKFGDKFVTRDGTILLYIGTDVDESHTAINEDGTFKEWYWVVTEDSSYLKSALASQKELIISKYGECTIKKNFKMTSTLELLK